MRVLFHKTRDMIGIKFPRFHIKSFFAMQNCHFLKCMRRVFLLILCESAIVWQCFLFDILHTMDIINVSCSYLAIPMFINTDTCYVTLTSSIQDGSRCHLLDNEAAAVQISASKDQCYVRSQIYKAFQCATIFCACIL